MRLAEGPLPSLVNRCVAGLLEAIDDCKDGVIGAGAGVARAVVSNGFAPSSMSEGVILGVVTVVGPVRLACRSCTIDIPRCGSFGRPPANAAEGAKLLLSSALPGAGVAMLDKASEPSCDGSWNLPASEPDCDLVGVAAALPAF